MAFVRILDPEKMGRLHEAGLLWQVSTDKSDSPAHCDAGWGGADILWKWRSDEDYPIHFGIVTEE